MTIKLKSEHVAYIEQALDTMLGRKHHVRDAVSDAYSQLLLITQYVATIAGHQTATELIDALANSLRANEELLTTFNEGFHMRIDMKRSLGQIETYEAPQQVGRHE